MWIALFSIASAAAIGFGVAAVMVQANQEEPSAARAAPGVCVACALAV